jgi:hypothetical protein
MRYNQQFRMPFNKKMVFWEGLPERDVEHGIMM